MVPSFAQTTGTYVPPDNISSQVGVPPKDKAKEVLHYVLEKMSKELNPNIQDLDTGIESSNETHGEGSILTDNSSPQTPNTDVGFDSLFDVKQELLRPMWTLFSHHSSFTGNILPRRLSLSR